jgi:hypothetical protein
MPVEYFVYAIISSALIVGIFNFIYRMKNVNIFYKKLQDMLYFYYQKYPRTSLNYFEGVVCSKRDAIMMFWVSDFNDFIQDGDLMEILFKGAQSYVKENPKHVSFESENGCDICFTPDPEGESFCPWCENSDDSQFHWLEFDDDACEECGDAQGTIQCICCGATTPTGTYDECIHMIKDTQEI